MEQYETTVSSRSHFYKVRDINYHFNVWGNEKAPLIFFLHGWADTGSTFQFVVDSFKNEWRIVAPDFRGFGKSDPNKSCYWFPDYLADIDEIKKIFSPDKPLILIGHSMGGNVASMYAGIFPENVSHLVNVEGFGLKESDPNNAPSRYQQWIAKQNDVQAFREYDSLHDLALRIKKKNQNISIERAIYVASQWAEKLDTGKIKLRADPKHKLPNATQYRRSEAEACWRLISAKTLCVFGKNSSFFKEVISIRENNIQKSWLNDSKIVEIPDAGHMIHLENPEFLANEIEDFIMNE